MTHPSKEILPDDGEVAVGDAQNYLARGFAWTPASAAEVNGTDLTGLEVREIILAAEHFLYDADDETSEHDPGGGVLVSGDGKRFLSETAPGAFVNVIARTNTPPAEPSAGDRYVVGPAPTGDWASNADDFARYTSAGWVFRAPQIGERSYNRAIQADIQWSEAGAWVTADATEDSIGPTELVWPFGGVVQAEQIAPPAAQISQGLGSAFGDMTANGGLAAAKDGTDSQAASASAAKTGAAYAIWGLQYTGGPQKCIYAVAVPTNDQGFLTAGGSTLTIELYGKNGSPVADGDEGTLLGTVGPFADTTDPVTIGVTGGEDLNEYEYLGFKFIPDTACNIHFAEGKFYESTTPDARVLYIAAAGAIGPWNGEDGNVLESDGADGWISHAAYEGAILFDLNEGRRKEFDGAEWKPASGNFRIVLRRYTSNQTWNKPAGLFGVKVWAMGGGGGGGGTSAGNAGQSSSFGAHLVAPGGGGGPANTGGGTGGGPATGSAADIFSLSGANGGSGNGSDTGGTGGDPATRNPFPMLPTSSQGKGGAGSNAGGRGGGGGACVAEAWIPAEDLNSAESVTVGSGGGGNGANPGSPGAQGEVFVEEWIRV